MSDEFFMDQALNLAKEALGNGEFPVGCVLVYDGGVVATGARVSSMAADRNELDHAEIIALRRLSQLNNGIDPGQIALYSTLEPCLMCFGALLIAGIGKIVYAYEDAMGGGTGCSLKGLPTLYRNQQTSLVQGILRQESLALFKAFFKNPRNDYLKGTLLADYTLQQPATR
jgi:tRNA(adenine34) deaminase